MGALLVVDLCGTIVCRNTTHEFMRCSALAFPRRLIARLVLSRMGGFILNRVGGGRQRKCLVACLWGMPRNALELLARDYARAALSAYPRSSVLNCIAEARQQGRMVVLASASLDFIVEAFAVHLGAQVAASSRLAFTQTGRCRGIIECDSTGNKLAILQQHIGSRDFEFDVITDNPEDSDLMGAASNVWFIHAEI